MSLRRPFILALSVSLMCAAPAVRAADTAIADGHQDLRFNFATGSGWSLSVFDHGTAQDHAPGSVWFDVSAGAEDVVPAGAQWLFLGQTAGEPLWILPQVQNADLPWLGTSTEATAIGVLTNNGAMRLKLMAASGPGEFSLYTVSAFGTPSALMTTSDGVSDADAINTRRNTHAHYNWAFTEPGTYRLTFQASGTPVATGIPVLSDPVTLEFRVVPEPAAPLLLAAGLAALRLMPARRRRDLSFPSATRTPPVVNT